jgi:hypothetical protein
MDKTPVAGSLLPVIDDEWSELSKAPSTQLLYACFILHFGTSLSTLYCCTIAVYKNVLR